MDQMDQMDLRDRIMARKAEIDAVKAIEDPDLRKMRVDGWKAHVALLMSCTAYADQITPELLRDVEALFS